MSKKAKTAKTASNADATTQLEGPDDISASVGTARAWIGSGTMTREGAAEWLHRQCPGKFADAHAADDEIGDVEAPPEVDNDSED